MTTKQFLYSVRDEQQEIRELNMRVYQLGMSLIPGAVRYDRDKVQTSLMDTNGDKMAELVDYEELLHKKLKRLYDKRQMAQALIDTLEDSRERQVLDLYFLDDSRPRMSDVADMMGYSRARVYAIYRDAFLHLPQKVETKWDKIRQNKTK